MSIPIAPSISRHSIGNEQQSGTELDHELMQDMDSVFSGEESTVIAAFQVRPCRHVTMWLIHLEVASGI